MRLHASTWAGLALVFASFSAAQTTMLRIQGTQTHAGLGSGCTEVGDVNNDGITDFAASGYVLSGVSRLPYVRVFSGANGTILQTWQSFASALNSPGLLVKTNCQRVADHNGDGVRDVAVAVWEEPDTATVPTTNGAVYILHGNTGAVIRSWQGAFLGDDYGKTLSDVGDVDNDGVSDLAIGTPQVSTNGAGGYVEVRSGANGNLIVGFGASSPTSSLGYQIEGIGDIDGDGTPDIAVGDADSGILVPSGPGRVIAYAMPSASVIYTVNPPPGAQHCGCGLANLGDLNSDGVSELAVTYRSFNNMRLRGIDGSTGSQLWENSNVGTAMIRASATGVPDMNGDGIRDAVVTDVGSAFSSTAARVLSGVDGSQLMIVTNVSTYSLGNNHVPRQTVAGLGDLNGDGLGEFVLGAARTISGQRGELVVVTNAPGLQAQSVTLANSLPGVSLTSPAPVIGVTALAAATGMTPGAPAFLCICPGPDVPFPHLGETVHLNLALFAAWSVFPFSANAAGSGTFVFTLPYEHGLAGIELTAQVYVPSGSPTLSNGLRLRFGYE